MGHNSYSQKTFSRLLITGIACSALTAGFVIPADDQATLGAIANPKPASRGAVACEAQECSLIGKELLSMGGNAVDALVGTTFCVGVIGMYHSGIGGGGFAVVRDKKGNYEAIDFRESAPAAAFQDMYSGNIQGSTVGGLAAGVPGEVRGLGYMHNKYGDLPWKTVMQGAIRVARDGFKGDSADFQRYMNAAISNQYNFLLNDPSWAEDFAPNGILVKEGDHFSRKRYAHTLELIAEHGPEAFYSGPLAESWIKTVLATNGTMTREDLEGYQVISRPVVETTYRGLTLHGIGSPAGGAVSLNILKIMEQYDAADWQDRALSTHRFDEAMRFAYSARLGLGDPDFVQNAPLLESQMLNEKTVKLIRNRILDNQTHPVEYYDEKKEYTTDSQGTSHIVTADDSGMATSLTTTVNLLFGAQIMDPVTGVVVNNEMNDFSIPGVRNEFGFVPSQANFIRPLKRPLSSCTPILASYPNGTLAFVVGAAGGSRIISATAQVIWHLVDGHHQTMADAILEPRIHDQLMPNYSRVEYKFDNSTVDSLLEKGHEVQWVREGLSAVQGIRILGGGKEFEPASEPRQGNSGTAVQR